MARTTASARASCALQPGFVESVQLNATGKLAISCEPLEAGGQSAPCIRESFFDFPHGFEHMNAVQIAHHYLPGRIDPFNQCRRRQLDDDWPTLELNLQRSSDTKRMANVMNLLQGRVVTLVGASIVRATFGALQCALATAGLRQAHELQWRLWGWATFTSDNGGCNYLSAMLSERNKLEGRSTLADRLRASRCIASGSQFVKMLASTDVVIVGYNPQHYEQDLNWWKLDLEHMLPLLEAFTSTPGKVAILREPPAQHFVGGEYSHMRRSFVSDRSGCCVPLRGREAYDNFNWRATITLHEAARRLAPSVYILPWYNVTLQRYASHIGTRANCFQRTQHGKWRRSDRCSCDCTHYCYTPLFYDATILTPLHNILLDHQKDEQSKSEVGMPRQRHPRMQEIHRRMRDARGGHQVKTRTHHPIAGPGTKLHGFG
jgi:hypothetical protein